MKLALCLAAAACASAPYVRASGYRVAARHPGESGARVHVTATAGDYPLLLTALRADGVDRGYTDEHGDAFVSLAPGLHWLYVDYAGIDQVAHVVVPDGVVTDIDVWLDTIGDAPVGCNFGPPTLDVGSTNQGRTLGADALRNVPWGTSWGLR
jgi:hypothetical protein